MAAIIRATPEDVPRIVRCAKEYTDIIPGVEFNEAHYTGYWRRALLNDNSVIFLAVDDWGDVEGGIGGIAYPELLSGKMTAVELFWYTRKDKRGAGSGIRLYRAFYEWAKARDCRRIAMIYLPCSMPDELKRFYEGQGFSLTEMHFEKEMT